MNFGPKWDEQELGFQMLPMVDVIFLLLIFFVSTSVFYQLEQELGLEIPVASESKPMERTPGEIIINIREDGSLVVNQREMNIEELRQLLKKIATYFKGQGVIIRGDRRVLLGRAIEVLDACAQADIWNVSFATLSRKEEETQKETQGS